MVCSLPAEFVWLETVKFNYAVRLPALRRAVKADALHNYTKAKRLWSTDQYVAKKNVLHGLRYLEFALQLATKGRVIDFTAATDVWPSILAATEWNQIAERVKPLYDARTQQIDQITDQFLLKSPKINCVSATRIRLEC
jgi:hypothetical protein